VGKKRGEPGLGWLQGELDFSPSQIENGKFLLNFQSFDNFANQIEFESNLNSI
jgi:hypothetical protein